MELEEEQQQAESLRREYRYDEALEIAEKHENEIDSRLEAVRDWASEFVEQVGKEKAEQEQLAANRYSEACGYLSACDYASGIQALQTIPNAFARSRCRNCWPISESREEEWRSLERTVRTRVKNRELTGLLRSSPAC